jgi:dihydroorotate dehydrogenase electron transfer subunit
MNNRPQQKPVMLRVEKKAIETPEFATLFFRHSIDFRPGQFVMVWIPGIDEKPYTVSYHDKDCFGITIEAKGIFSKKAVSLVSGDLVGFRGPFGNGFSIDTTQKISVVAGGCGMAPLAPLVEKFDKEITFIQGARTKAFILYPDRFKSPPLFCTDDGSFGYKGFVTDLLETAINEVKTFDMVFTCGPEVMMHKVFEICEKNHIPCQVSLERYMRCGFGVCGACVCGKQIVCKDGPAFGSDQLRQMDDFNTKALLKSGKEMGLPDYFSWRCK